MLGFEVKNSLAHDPQTEQRSQYIAMTSSLLERNVVVVEVNGYHLIFDINGILVVTGEGSTRSRPMV
jgi:antibiotic biosynthesis monooxygenase (ABM) superfamily enzyme